MRPKPGLWVVTALMVFLMGMGGSTALAQGDTSTSPATNTPNPVVGDTVSYITDGGSPVADLRVREVISGWDGYSEYYMPTEGNLYVAIVVEVTNLGVRGNLIVRADDFRLQDVDGFFWSRSWADASETATLIPAESEIVVAPGETEDVVLVYEVLANVQLTHLFWQPEYERLLTIANLDDYTPGQG